MIAIYLAIALQAPARSPTADGTPLDLADLPSYLEALAEVDPAPATPISFRELWDNSQELRGRRVRVRGRLVRRFHQAAIGQFPPLVEAWLTTESGDLICLVYPRDASPESPALGTSVQFGGLFLKRVRYAGSDVDRLAPLIVGADPPEIVQAPRTQTIPARAPFHLLDWIVGTAAAGVVFVALITRMLRRPVSRIDERLLEPAPPVFLTDEPDAWKPTHPSA